MENNRIPKQGEIFKHFKGKLYQIITVATHTETMEALVIYQALYGEFKTYARPLEMFISEVDHVKYPEAAQKYRFELKKLIGIEEDTCSEPSVDKPHDAVIITEVSPALDTLVVQEEAEGTINLLLLEFLEAESYSKKLEVLTINKKKLDDRLINDMAASLDCMVNEGPLEQRLQELGNCLQAMRRFEDRRLR